jgi:hypothetical protein
MNRLPQNIILIDSARQAEKHEDFKNSQNLISAEQLGNLREKNYLLNNFATVRPIFTISILVDSDSSQHRLHKTASIYDKKTSKFKASGKDSKKLQKSWA